MARRRQQTSNVDSAAIAVGTALGHAAARVESWRAQGDDIAADVKRFVAHAHDLLSELGHQADVETARVVASAKKGAKSVSRASATRSKQIKAEVRTMSAKVRRAGASVLRTR